MLTKKELSDIIEKHEQKIELDSLLGVPINAFACVEGGELVKESQLRSVLYTIRIQTRLNRNRHDIVPTEIMDEKAKNLIYHYLYGDIYRGLIALDTALQYADREHCQRLVNDLIKLMEE